MIARAIRVSSAAALLAVICNYLAYLAGLAPYSVDLLGEWIMARTPTSIAVVLLERLGPWAKPFASTGGLALIGFVLFPAGLAASAGSRQRRQLAPMAAFGAISLLLGFCGLLTLPILATLAIPAAVAAAVSIPRPVNLQRRAALVMASGVFLVAIDAYAREWRRRSLAVEPQDLFAFRPPLNPPYFAKVARKPVTPVNEFYVMSKNTVDPSLDERTWRMRVAFDGRAVHEYDYRAVMDVPREEFYSTLRCISNTLKSDLMGTAQWSGFHLERLLPRGSAPQGTSEVAFIGVDGHGDSFPVDYIYSDSVHLVVGMNGKTLERLHGFPLRLIAPRYYGFKNVKWIREIRFVSKPYIGTWPAMGWSKEALVHTTSHIDRVQPVGTGLLIGGVAFAGDRGIQCVRVRADGNDWHDATLENPLSPYCWTRWWVQLPVAKAASIEARAQDGRGEWQRASPKQMFPDGVAGPTVKLI